MIVWTWSCQYAVVQPPMVKLAIRLPTTLNTCLYETIRDVSGTAQTTIKWSTRVLVMFYYSEIDVQDGSFL